MEKRCVGIDIGGTSVKFGLFDMDGRLLEKWSIPTNTKQNGIHILPEIAASVNRKMQSCGIRPVQIAGAGVGVPGQVAQDGTVLFAENLGWMDVPVTKELSRLMGMPVLAENDANLAALGEIWRGSAAQCHSMIFVTLGTGIGCGIVINDQILSGADGAAGEIGHIHIEDRMTEPCNCGKSGCLEQLASATGLRRIGKKVLEMSQEPSVLRQGEVSARTIFDAARKKDRLALRIADQFGMYLGKALAMCACVVNPEIVVIGGGVSKAGDIVLEYIRKYYQQYVYPPCAGTAFRLAELGSDAGIYGGAKLVIEQAQAMKWADVEGAAG